MKKFGQILALVFALAFGYGLGQHTQDLFATDYPGGGAGGGTHPVNLASDVTGELPHGETSDDAAQVHGLAASVNVLGNLDASGEFIQRSTGTGTSAGGDQLSHAGGGSAVTFGTAYSAAPKVMGGGTTEADNVFGYYAHSVGTTGFTPEFTARTASQATVLGWVAVGN